MDVNAVSHILLVAVVYIGALVDISTGQLVQRYDFFSNVNATFFLDIGDSYHRAGSTWNTDSQMWIPTFNFHTLGYFDGSQFHENAFSNFKSGGKIFSDFVEAVLAGHSVHAAVPQCLPPQHNLQQAY